MRSDPFLLLGLGTAALSAIVLLWFLLRRPKITRSTKIALAFGIGVLPLMTAVNGNVTGYHTMKTRTFCGGGGCHVMVPYAKDSENPASLGLAARHARNATFGEDNCYTCHADYGMFGTVTTKLGGMRHVYEYALHFHQLTLEEALPKIHIRTPFQNATCIRCHSTQNPLWNKVGEHTSMLVEIRAGTTSCASPACHGAAHPFSNEIHLRSKP